MEDLREKVSIVTGSAMGIGKTVAVRLARDGSDVALIDLKKNLMKGTVKEIEGMGRKALSYDIDISQWDQVQKVVDDILKNFQRIDILVNSAGILGPNVAVSEYPVEEWDRVIAVDLRGTFLLCKAVIEPMQRQKSGRIVNIASIAGKEGNPFMGAYSAAKAAVIGFTRSLAMEVVQDGIIANAISPTVIEGRMVESVTEEQQKYLLSKIPMGRFGKPEEVANMIRFMVSNECSFCTGHNFDLSGGRAVY